jgi:hypothetical protein
MGKKGWGKKNWQRKRNSTEVIYQWFSDWAVTR